MSKLEAFMLATLIFSCQGCGIRGGGVKIKGAVPDNPVGLAVWTAEDQYSRNSIVCAPTLIGNALGTFVGSPFLLGAAKAKHEHWNLAADSLWYTGMVPVYALGGALGTPFLPFSYLKRSDPCSVDFGH
jgi:hypothetical protein